jgi:hypothetical protein
MRKIKPIITISSAVILIAVFSLRSDIVIESVMYSLRLCYGSVIPSLFPFFILCEFLMSATAGAGSNHCTAAFATGLITGFPTGVRNVCKLYSDGNIDKKSACALLHCTANASPAYIVAFIGVCIIGSKTAGIILLISQVLCAFACAVFFGCFKRRREGKSKIGVINITEIACQSISNSVISCLYVCGYIIFFGIIADIAIKAGLPSLAARIMFFLPENQAGALSVGFIEITRGIYMLDFSDNSAIIIAAVIVAFSGISVIMQCIACVIKAGLPKRPLITGKIIYTVMMPIIATCLSEIISVEVGSPKSQMPVISFILFIIFLITCIIFIYNIFDKSKRMMYNKIK